MTKRILIAPLDWGLGHATRCIPVIKEFLKQNCEVQIASSGSAFILLKKEFPELVFHELTSYRISYSSWQPFLIKILLQLPRLLTTVRKEHRQINQIVSKENIDLIVSDNRYGCWSTEIPSILIIHQVTLKVPFFSSFVNFFHQRAIRKFSYCWIPDWEGDDPLAGELSTNKNLNVKYIGLLSRMEWGPTENRYDILVIISGPEPQRTIFENLLRRELVTSAKKYFIVRGLPEVPEESKTLNEANYFSTEEMNKAMLESDMIVCRSGYSTIMDLAVLGKKVIVVPTPGQSEQEYLAEELRNKKIALSVKQDKFNLAEALEQSKAYTGFIRTEKGGELSKAINECLNEI